VSRISKKINFVHADELYLTGGLSGNSSLPACTRSKGGQSPYRFEASP
jgi:hypothetical protein